MRAQTAILGAAICLVAIGVQADDTWNVGHWHHDATGQLTLDIKSAVRPRGVRSLVYVPVSLVVRGTHACVAIPSPLHRFVEQDVVFSRVTATADGRQLEVGKEFFVRLVVSDQDQPFYCAELNGVAGDVTINTEAFVLLPPEQDLPRWQRAVASLEFQSKSPNDSNVPAFQYHVPPANVGVQVDTWATAAFENHRSPPLAGLIHAVKYVHQSMKYEGVVKYEDPYEGLVDDFKGHCGIYGAGLSVVGQQLKQRYGMQVFNAGGYWGGPHVKNGVIAYLRDGTPVFMFADATQPDIGPQGQLSFVVTSVAGWNTFSESAVPKTPAGLRPPNVPFAVNTMGIRHGEIIAWLPVSTKRVDLSQISLPETTKQKIRSDIRRLNLARDKVYSTR